MIDLNRLSELKTLIERHIQALDSEPQDADTNCGLVQAIYHYHEAADLHHAETGFIDVDYDEGLIGASSTARRIWGFTDNFPQSSSIDFWLSRVHPDDRETGKAHYFDVLPSEEIQLAEHRILLPSGEVRWVRARFGAFPLKSGKKIGVAHLLDISELRSSEAQLESALTDLSEHKDVRMRLYSTLGQELHTPLASLKMMVDSGNYDPELFSDALDHSLAVLDSLHLAADPEGALEFQPTSDSILRVVQSVVSRLQTFMLKTPLDIQIVGDRGSREITNINVPLVRQIITNIIKNTMQHSEADLLMIDLKTQSERPDWQQVQISFDDNGLGIESDKREQLFTPFADAGQPNHHAGLGLYVARQLTHRLNGQLRLEPSSLGGTRFVAEFELPRPDWTGLDRSLNGAESECSILSGKRVLLAEDSAILQKLTSELLERMGARVSQVSSGDRALEQILKSMGEDPIDLVIADLFMPGISGVELCSNLRSEGYLGKVLGMTAVTVAAEVEELMEAGADGVLCKPINADQLVEVLGEIGL